MNKFTPGPWKVHAERWISAERNGHDGPIIVAPSWWMEDAPEEAAANAALIAAAPDLYEALKAMVDAEVDYMTINKLARAALALAEGRDP